MPSNGLPTSKFSLMFMAETEDAYTSPLNIDGKFKSFGESKVSCKAKICISMKSDDICSVLVL